MDTTEELNGTYFYAGYGNLTAGGLFFLVFCEQFAEQLGIEDFVAIVAILSGRNNLPTRAKPKTATPGTSYASKAARKVFGNLKFPFGIKLPSWVGGYTPWTMRKKMVAQVSTFVGRFIPILGVLILAKDVTEVGYFTVIKYNQIARKEDQIW